MKQNAVVELYYNDQWNTALARERSPFYISRGLRNEAGAPVPQTATLTLDGLSDSYNPYDPASVIYGLTGRNTPIRISLEPGNTTGVLADGTDAFGRTVASGWGTADVGGAWSTSGSGGTVAASDWSVTGGVGTVSVPAAPAFRRSRLEDLDIEDCTAAVTFTCPQATGANLEPANLTFREAGGFSVNTLVRVTVDTSNAVAILIYNAASVLLGSVTVAGLTHAGAGTPLRVMARLAGQDIWAKVWNPAGAEPDWHLHVVDSAPPVSGAVGIRSGRASGNTNSTTPQFTYDDYAVTVSVPRFVGEVASWKPQKTVDFDPATGRGDRSCDIEAAGVMRRLSQRASPLRSALYRYLSAASEALAYWPLEEGDQTARAGEVRGGGGPGQLSGSPQFGTDPGGLTGAESVVSISGGAILTLPISVTPTSGGWSLSFMLQYPSTPGGLTQYAIISSTGTAETWFFDADATQFTWEVYDTGGSLLDSYTTAYGAGAEPPAWLAVQLNVNQNGGNIDWDVKWNPVGTGTFWWTGVQSVAGTVGRPTTVYFTGQTEFHVGHVVVGNYGAVDVTLLANLATGKSGELVETRMSRLCGEEGVTFELAGTANATPPMSGQTAKTLVSLQTEAANADQGILHEPRGYLGFRYRPARSLYNQTAALALDMTAGDVAPPLYPVIDDLPTENDVTARRPRGSEFRAVLTSGRMSTQDPPDGAGRTAVEYDAAVFADTQLPDWAQWRLHLGTVDEARYPQVTVDLDAAPSRADAVNALDIGDLITIASLDNQPTVELIVLGYTEMIGTHRRMITFNCAPGSPYRVGSLDTSGYDMLGSDGSVTVAAVAAGTDTSMLVFDRHDYGWSTGSVDIDLNVSGCELNTTAIASVCTDTFGRSVSSGWGTATSGQAWTTSGGSASDYSVASGAGVHSQTTVGTIRTALLDIGSPDCTYTVLTWWSITSATGASATTWLCGRVTDTNNYYTARLDLNTAGNVTIALYKRVAGTLTAIASAVTVGANTALDLWQVTLRISGSHIHAKARNATTGQGELSVTATDTALTTGNNIGLLSRLETGNTNTLPVGVRFDNLTVSNPQTFTISTTVGNGIAKTIPAGSQVRLLRPAYIGM